MKIRKLNMTLSYFETENKIKITPDTYSIGEVTIDFEKIENGFYALKGTLADLGKNSSEIEGGIDLNKIFFTRKNGQNKEKETIFKISLSPKVLRNAYLGEWFDFNTGKKGIAKCFLHLSLP